MKARPTLRTEINYKKKQWGLGLSGWWFNTDASASGRVTTPKEIFVIRYPEAYGTVYVNGVRMWDHTITPVYNELEPSLMSPVDYWARNDLSVWTIDLFGIRTLPEKKDSHIDATFGLKLGSLDNERNEGQSQRAFVYNKIWEADAWRHLDNRITLKSISEADYGLMSGPAIGLQGKAKYKSVRLEGMLNQSLLIGSVKQSGTWIDIDNIWLYTDPVTPYRQLEYLEGKFFFSKEETTALPVTEAKLKFLFDVVKNFSIGIGGFTSIWWNAPIAPKWSIPGDWIWYEGTGWRLEKSTLIFYGGMAAFNIRF